MAKYEISDSVKDNILKLISRVEIKGSEAPVVMEIFRCLSMPVVEKIKEREKKDGS